MSLFDLLFPKICLGCNKKGRYICTDCITQIGKPRLICPICMKSSIDGFTHSKCLTRYSLDGLFFVFKYDGVIKKALKSIKFKFASDIVSELTNYSVKALQASTLDFSNDFIVIPVPLHSVRENWRGFNQSELLGKGISHKIGLRYTNKILLRVKNTLPQSTLKKESRLKNIISAFEIAPLYRKKLQGRKIVVFDDVHTTGSTIKEIGKVLKRAGASKVWGLTVAH